MLHVEHTRFCMDHCTGAYNVQYKKCHLQLLQTQVVWRVHNHSVHDQHRHPYGQHVLIDCIYLPFVLCAIKT
jgi:hypothetical protein